MKVITLFSCLSHQAVFFTGRGLGHFRRVEERTKKLISTCLNFCVLFFFFYLLFFAFRIRLCLGLLFSIGLCVCSKSKLS